MRDRNSLQDLVGYDPEHYARAGTHRDRIAVQCGDRALTWRELGDRVHRLARAWQIHGYRPGQTIATFLPNRVEIIEVFCALGQAGMINATINAKFMADEFAHTVAFSDAVALVVDAHLLPVVDQAMPSLPEFDRSRIYVVGGEGLDHGYASYEELLASGDDAPVEPRPDEDDPIWMAFTGGTTGPAKACLATHRSVARLWRSIAFEMGVRRNERTLIAVSMNHALGIYFGMTTLHLGGTVVMMPEFNPLEAMRIIEREQITFIPSAPSLYAMMLDAAAASGETVDVSSVHLVVTGGAPLTTTLKHRLIEAFPGADLVSGYGGTESGLFGVVHAEEQRILERSAGTPPLGVEVKVVDDEGDVCAPGQVGTIYARGWHTAVEYYKNPSASDAQFDGEWYTLDDMGYVDEAGNLFVTDRRKNMIVSSGINVFPAEIESVLAAHPAVAESAVIGIPDDKWGELVYAVVVVRPGAAVTPEELDAHCRAHLARYKVPRRFEFRQDLPRTYAGKVSHRDIRAPFWGQSVSLV